jgi:hypothetical protein
MPARCSVSTAPTCRWLIEKKQLPDCQSWDELRKFMELRGACEAAVEAGREVWLEYKR